MRRLLWVFLEVLRGILIGKLDERTRECSRSGGICNIKFAFPRKLDRGSPIQGFGPKFLSVSRAVEMEARKQEFFNWVLIKLVKLVTTFFVF